MKASTLSSPNKISTFQEAFKSISGPWDYKADEKQSLLETIAKRNTAKILTKTDESNSLRAESKMARRRLAMLLNYFPGGILIETPNRRILHVNQKFCNMFGIKANPEVLQDANCDVLVNQTKYLFRDNQAFMRTREQYLRAGKPVQGDKLVLKDGRMFVCNYLPLEIAPGYVENLWHFHEMAEYII